MSDSVLTRNQGAVMRTSEPHYRKEEEGGDTTKQQCGNTLDSQGENNSDVPHPSVSLICFPHLWPKLTTLMDSCINESANAAKCSTVILSELL